MTSIHQTLIDIQETQSFERLEPFKQPHVWKTLIEEERLLLAKLLVLQGAQQLAQGNHQVLESFEIASQISSYDFKILYQQGVILSYYRHNIRCLNLACQAFAQSLQQNAHFFEGWYAHAQVLTDIGLFEAEGSYFTEAHQNFEKAYALLDSANNVCKEEFYWKWGVCLSSLGKLSGEPSDFCEAIEKYYQAYELGYQDPAFLNDYGHGFADLAFLLEKQEYFAEAIKLFNCAIHQNPQSFESWYNQACCIQNLGEFAYHDKLLEHADHSFAKAAELNPLEGLLWLRWGQLEATIGKTKRDQQKLELSIEKFAKAYELEPDHPQILNCWADAELFLGAQEERLDLIHSAQTKILNNLESQPENPDIWYLYGSCLNELGQYFDEEDYYYQAIEKFQYGLSLTRNHALLWYGMALSYFALGELTEQQILFEKAAYYCSKVIECGDGCAQFWNDWGVTLLKLAEISQQSLHVEMAIEKFERALKQPIENLELANVDLEWVYNYGCAFDLLGDLTEEPCHFEKSVHILTQVFQLDPDYQQARYNLALALSHLAEAMCDIELYHKAIEHLQYLMERDSEDDMIHLDLGISLTNLALLVQDVHHPERSQILYCQAEHHLMQAAVLGNTSSYYQLAGLYSMTMHYDHAMHYLERSQFSGTLPKLEDLLHDEWLEGLRQTPSFRQFINALSSQQSTDDK